MRDTNKKTKSKKQINKKREATQKRVNYDEYKKQQIERRTKKNKRKKTRQPIQNK